MGIPDLYSYYLAMILSQGKFWWHPTKSEQCSMTEQTLFPHKNPRLLLFAIGAGLTTSLKIPPLLQATATAWTHAKVLHALTPKTQMVLLPLQLLSMMALDLDLQPWTRSGITLLEHIYEGDTLKTFQALRTKFG